ncbi:MAG: hypothetical protein WA461_05070 [Nitrososphaeraceae archaeon]
MYLNEEKLTISDLAEILDKNERTIRNALSRINTNAARAFENTARETAAEFLVSNRQREVYR